MNDDPMTWTEADLQSHIDNQVEESGHLDYKAAEALTGGHGKSADAAKAEIGKDVAAFANSAGGMLIYGITENPTDKRFPDQLLGVAPGKHSKEWLEQIIRGQVTRASTGCGSIPSTSPAATSPTWS